MRQEQARRGQRNHSGSREQTLRRQLDPDRRAREHGQRRPAARHRRLHGQALREGRGGVQTLGRDRAQRGVCGGRRAVHGHVLPPDGPAGGGRQSVPDGPRDRPLSRRPAGQVGEPVLFPGKIRGRTHAVRRSRAVEPQHGQPLLPRPGLHRARPLRRCRGPVRRNPAHQPRAGRRLPGHGVDLQPQRETRGRPAAVRPGDRARPRPLRRLRPEGVHLRRHGRHGQCPEDGRPPRKRRPGRHGRHPQPLHVQGGPAEDAVRDVDQLVSILDGQRARRWSP